MTQWQTPGWGTFAAGREAAEDLLGAMGAPVAKADDVLTRPGYDAIVRKLLRLIQKETHGPDTAAYRAAARKLDRDWATLTVAARNAAIAAAASSLKAVPKLVVTPVSEAIARVGGEVANAAARASHVAIGSTFTAVDPRVIEHAARSQANYITDIYGNRAVALEQKARDIVADGIAQGLGSADIGERLAARIVGPGMRTAASYWDTIASIHTARARAWGQLSAFTDAGIDTYEWVSVLDEVTTEQCRFLSGRTFSVAHAVATHKAVEESDDPYAVSDLMPWVRQGKTEDGAQFLYVEDNAGKRTHLADVHEAGFGTSDKIGTYGRAASSAKLQSLGVGNPPCHARCRSLIIPA